MARLKSLGTSLSMALPGLMRKPARISGISLSLNFQFYIAVDSNSCRDSKLGKILPTGRIVNEVDGASAACIDVKNPCNFVKASGLDVKGDVLADAIGAHPTLLKQPNLIRRQAAVAMSISKAVNLVPGSILKVAIVSNPYPHKLISGQEVNEDVCDVLMHTISVGQLHHAVLITVAIVLAATSRLPDSTVSQCTCKNLVDPA